MYVENCFPYPFRHTALGIQFFKALDKPAKGEGKA